MPDDVASLEPIAKTPNPAFISEHAKERRRYGHIVRATMSRKKARHRMVEIVNLSDLVVKKLREEFSSVDKLTATQVRAAGQIIKSAVEAEQQMRITRGDPMPGTLRRGTVKTTAQPEPDQVKRRPRSLGPRPSAPIPTPQASVATNGEHETPVNIESNVG